MGRRGGASVIATALIFNLLIIGLAIVGFCLDYKKKLLFDSDKGTKNSNEKRSAYDATAHDTPSKPGVNPGAPAPVPDNSINASVRDRGIQDAVGIEMSEIKPDVNPNRAHMNQAVSSAIESSVAAPAAKSDSARPTFLRMYCNAFKFYSRSISIFFSVNRDLSRAFKALNLGTQIAMITLIVSALMFTHLLEHSVYDSSQIGIAFGIMRLVQPILGLTLIRGCKKERAAVIGFLIGQIILFMFMQIGGYAAFSTMPKVERSRMRRETFVVVILELIVWAAIV